MADLAYSRKQFKTAFAFYDSLQTGDSTLTDRLADIQARRNALVKIVEKIVIIEREDSLQAIAAMEPGAREAMLKKMVKRLRKESGLKEEDTNTGGAMIGFDSRPNDRKDEPVDLFASSGAKGEWYFYNSGLKSKGFNEFKRKWGTRKNADDWRRKSATAPANSTQIVGATMAPDDIDKPVPPGLQKIDDQAGAGKFASGNTGTTQSNDVSYEGLMANVPLTAEKLQASHRLLSLSLFELAQLFQQELEDYEQAIITYDQSLLRYPDSLYNGNLYLGLYFCYNKLGYKEKAAYYKNLINKNFSTSRAALLLNNPSAANPQAKTEEGTKRYETIYNQFIEGNFDQAFADKKKADSIYGNNYWSPQLLYIEAVYHIKQHADSAAIGVLGNIVSLYPQAKLTPKAVRMIDVLKRRAEIEDYLSKLEITRAKDDEIVRIDDAPKLVRNDSTLVKPPVVVIDTTTKVVTPLDTVKVVTQTIPQTIKDTPQVIQQPPIKKDTAKTVIAPVILPSVKDSVKAVPTLFSNGPFTLNTQTSQNVIMIMDKVDGTYVNESKNAFARYLGESFKGQPITLVRDAIDKDRSLLIFTSFKDAATALDFLLKVKKAAPDEISWLPANKYSFYLINDENLQLLKTNKDIAAYIALLNKVYPGQF